MTGPTACRETMPSATDLLRSYAEHHRPWMVAMGYVTDPGEDSADPAGPVTPQPPRGPSEGTGARDA